MTEGIEDLGQEEWCKRFVTRMVDTAGHDRFDDGELVIDYARDTAPTYFEIENDRALGPEACADADMSYWGDE